MGRFSLLAGWVLVVSAIDESAACDRCVTSGFGSAGHADYYWSRPDFRGYPIHPAYPAGGPVVAPARGRIVEPFHPHSPIIRSMPVSGPHPRPTLTPAGLQAFARLWRAAATDAIENVVIRAFNSSNAQPSPGVVKPPLMLMDPHAPIEPFVE